MLKILGFLDIISAIVLFLVGFTKLAIPILLIFAFYMIAKGILFAAMSGLDAGSFASFVDIAIGVVFYLSVSFTIPKLILSIGSLFLIQKGILSLAY